MNEDPKPTDNMELLKQQADACGPGCGCHTPGSAGKWRLIVGVIVLAVAGVLVARAVVKANGDPAAPASTGFAALAAPAQMPEPPAAATRSEWDAVKEITALSELNTVAANTVGVFVFLPGKGETITKAPMAQIRGAARTIEAQLRGGKIGIFTLQTSSPDYGRVASQVAVPGVLAMVKGGGMGTASGDITESSLVQAYVAASSAGGCAPGASCGPGTKGCK
jgi:hypothetical protein